MTTQPALCEIDSCGVIAAGRCGHCGRAFCLSHRADRVPAGFSNERTWCVACLSESQTQFWAALREKQEAEDSQKAFAAANLTEAFRTVRVTAEPVPLFIRFARLHRQWDRVENHPYQYKKVGTGYLLAGKVSTGDWEYTTRRRVALVHHVQRKHARWTVDFEGTALAFDVPPPTMTTDHEAAEAQVSSEGLVFGTVYRNGGSFELYPPGLTGDLDDQRLDLYRAAAAP